jgi:hypothetical protein
VTRQTVIGYFAFCVAIHTPAHRHFHPWFLGRCFALPDISVTSLALQLAQNDMAPVGKKDMVGLSVEPFPWNFFPLLLKLSDLFLLKGLGQRFLMAFKAGFQVGHPGKGLGFVETMAGIALQSLFQVLFMIE